MMRDKGNLLADFQTISNNDGDYNEGGDDDVKAVMLKAGQLPSSVSNLLHWEIALFTGGPSTQLSGGCTYSPH